jgi:hypothetical protein
VPVAECRNGYCTWGSGSSLVGGLACVSQDGDAHAVAPRCYGRLDQFLPTLATAGPRRILGKIPALGAAGLHRCAGLNR